MPIKKSKSAKRSVKAKSRVATKKVSRKKVSAGKKARNPKKIEKKPNVDPFGENTLQVGSFDREELEKRVLLQALQVIESRKKFEDEVEQRKQVTEAFDNLSRRNELILSAAGEGIYGIDCEGNTTFINPAAAKMIGYSPQELVGKQQHDVLHHTKPDGSPYPKEECPIYLAFKDGKARHVADEIFWRKDDTRFPVEYISTPIIENGKILGAVVTFNDITERKKAEQALRESKTRVQSILDHAIDGIISINEQGMVESFNPAAERLFGYKSLEVVGQNVTLLMPESFKSKHENGLKNYLETGVKKVIEVDGVEVVGLRKDGTTFPLELGISEMYLGIVRDITERKFLEQKLWSSEQRYRTMSESSPLGIFQIDGDDFYIYVNNRWQEIVGKTLTQSFGVKWWEIIHPGDRDNVFRKWAESEQQGRETQKKPFSITCRILRQGGGIHWGQINCSFLFNDEGRITIGTLEDITKRKKTEIELERSNEELEGFAAIASHDLKEPLRKVIAFGDRLQSILPDLDSQAKNYLDRMRNATERMQLFIDDLLKFSKVSSQTSAFEKVDLNKLVANVLEDLETRISRTKGMVNIVNLPTLEMDPFKTHQLFLNLIGNGLKFHREGVPPVVTLTSFHDGVGNWEIKIEDNGIGFNEKYAERIFKPFERLHGNSAYEGTGMGLAICRKIVSHHDGEITVHSQPGKGTVFTITLPETQRNKRQ